MMNNHLITLKNIWTRLMIKVKPAILPTIAIVLFFLLLLSIEATQARHPETNTFFIGEVLVGQGAVCDRADQWTRVVERANTQGKEAAFELYKTIQDSEKTAPKVLACGAIYGSIQITSVIWEGTYLGEPAAIVEILWVPVGSTEPHPKPLYALLEHAVRVDNTGKVEIL